MPDMSDGPYKSLPLSRGWKKIAKCAENEAYSVEEIRDAVAPALAEDWRLGQLDAIAKVIASIMDNTQGALYDPVEQLEALQAASAGDAFRQTFVQCAIQQAEAGATGEAALVRSAEDALDIWAARHARPIEEHYCREWDEGRALNVRDRIEGGFSITNFEGVARQLLGIDAAPIVRVPPRSGLDEGPRR
jgi:hypothetical protein